MPLQSHLEENLILLAGSRQSLGTGPDRRLFDNTLPTRESATDSRLGASLSWNWAFTYCFIVFSECCIDHAAVEENLGCIRNLIKVTQRLFKFLIVVGVQGLHPCFYLL